MDDERFYDVPRSRRTGATPIRETLRRDDISCIVALELHLPIAQETLIELDLIAREAGVDIREATDDSGHTRALVLELTPEARSGG